MAITVYTLMEIVTATFVIMRLCMATQLQKKIVLLRAFVSTEMLAHKVQTLLQIGKLCLMKAIWRISN